MLKIFKNKNFPFQSCEKIQQKDYIFFISFKQNKKALLLTIPENTGDRMFSARKTKIPTEYRAKGIRCFKN